MKKELKIFRLFRSLTSEDIRKIKKNIKKGSSSADREIEKLFNLLCAEMPKNAKKKFDRAAIESSFFQQQKNREVDFRRLCSSLLKKIEIYLIDEKTKLSKLETELALLDIYRELNCPDLYQNLEVKLLAQKEIASFKDKDFYESALKLNKIRRDKIASSNFDKRISLLQEAYLLNHTNYLLAQKKIEVELTSFHNMKKGIAELPKLNKDSDNLILKIYKRFDEMYETKTIESMYRVKELLFSNIANIRKEVALEILQDLINFVMFMMSTDDKKFRPVAFDFYKVGLEKGLFIRNDQIIVSAFTNLNSMAANLGKVEWAKKFVVEHEHLLPKKEKGAVKNFALARIYFIEKKFKSSLDCLKKIRKKELSHPNLRLAVELTRIRSGYEYLAKEENYYDNFFKILMTFERWNNRNKEGQNFEPAQNFIKMIRRMATVRVGEKIPKDKRLDLMDLLQSFKKIVSRGWLIEQLEK